MLDPAQTIIRAKMSSLDDVQLGRMVDALNAAGTPYVIEPGIKIDLAGSKDVADAVARIRSEINMAGQSIICRHTSDFDSSYALARELAAITGQDVAFEFSYVDMVVSPESGPVGTKLLVTELRRRALLTDSENGFRLVLEKSPVSFGDVPWAFVSLALAQSSCLPVEVFLDDERFIIHKDQSDEDVRPLFTRLPAAQ